MMLFVFFLMLLLTACSHPKTARVNVPPPPPPESRAEAPNPTATTSIPRTNEKRIPEPKLAEPEPDLDEPTLPPDTRPIATESGVASWYGPPYHNRRGSNGEIYNMHAMTAAHRTYALGSIVRVTNLKTGATALVRITDRGPFIRGRILDLSLAAAEKLDVKKAGVAKVKVELMQSPAILTSRGKWAVQIGGFPDEEVASKFADHLTHRYHTANVLRFASPTGAWWIRVRVLDDDHDRAQKLAAETKSPAGGVFLVRLD